MVDSKDQTESAQIESAPRHEGYDEGNNAVLLDVGAAHLEKGGVSLRLAKDGHTVLVPQPSDDPNDPLNWSPFKKHMILFIVGLAAFCGDFGSGAGIPCIVPQAQEWGMTPYHVNFAGNLNVLMLGIGGLLWIPLFASWGRGPVLFWTQVSGSLFTLGCAVTDDFDTFYGLRAMMGLTLTVCQVLGLSYIKDMFYFHEHARKIGIWAAMFLLSPYCGPLFGNFIIDGTGDWRPVFWLVFAVCIADLVLIVLFADECWYRRDIPMAEQPARGNRITRLVGIWRFQVRNNYFRPIGWSVARLFIVFLKPVMIPTMCYYCFSFMWAVGINITSSLLFEVPQEQGGYGFGAKAVGFVYFTPVVAVSLGEFFGHFFNDWVARRYVKKHDGVFIPEARLVTNYIGAVCMIPGLIIVGQALEKHLHWAAIVMGWGIYVFGVMTASVAVTAYALDAYPTGSGEVAGLLNFARTIGGFAVGYFQSPWGELQGFGTSFGIQAAIVGFALLILICLHQFGERMRAKGSPLKF
ncbi:major facilitator superfamily domain-containing protein [Lineolata rhizophorae]|uniref:Major facilitator superfamily domain-containing protein n=1 Tax=Lineolata rhizophorae TaxID=578093 RepID=A0A6A6P105_9PEZI|nr:major facilitator superfamily domain-containing protein [Lineolata rhizophorae]